MPSWQSHIIKILFRLRLMINPHKGVLDVKKTRAETESLAANFKTKVEYSHTPIEINKVPAEWIRIPKGSEDSVILYLHGGSYNSGSINSHRSLVANIAASANIQVLIVDYRLAPENPFPAAVEDTIAAYRWLVENNFSPSRIVVAGDSCGGGLALSLLISLRDANEQLPAAAVCLSPWTDLTCTGETWKTNDKSDLMLDPGAILESAHLYLGKTDPRTPLASPLYADFNGLPPILIQVGSDECILSDSTRFAEEAKATGIDVTLEVWEGMQHEWHFAASILPEGRQAIDRIGKFIRNQVGLK